MPKPEDTKKKGSFGVARLPVALNYIFPDRRRTMIVIGGLACLALLGYFLADFFLLKSSFTASGPVSSYHATFEKDCAKCHDQFKAVTDANCSVCHEKAGAKTDAVTGDEQKIYTFAAHYLYRSENVEQVKAAKPAYADRETPCYICHQEHKGREARITNVPDSRCLDCHRYGSFNKTHPEFDFAVEKIPDDSTMKFTHIKHVREVVKLEKLVDIERACLYCHNPQPDGKNFGLINFDQHCDACHLTTSVATSPLKVKDDADPYAPGVETLEAIRQRRGPGTLWAFYANPFEFKPRGNRVVKQPLYHQDPWILENLRRIRRLLYPDLEFADLLKAAGKLTSQSPQALSATVYQEAIQTLQNYSLQLRNRPEPEIQRDLAQIDSLLKEAQSTLRRQTNTIAGPPFLAQPAPPNPALDATQIADLKAFAQDVAGPPCLECHIVSNANILRVQKDQRILKRAEFDHRAHTLERRCLECHTQIAITKEVNGATVVRPQTEVSELEDRAAIQNIPNIANCRDCHNPAESSNRCVTCHYFHPNKTQRSSLLLYLD